MVARQSLCFHVAGGYGRLLLTLHWIYSSGEGATLGPGEEIPQSDRRKDLSQTLQHHERGERTTASSLGHAPTGEELLRWDVFRVFLWCV